MQRSIWYRLKRERWSYLFILPTLALFSMFTLRSMFFSFYYALHQWRGIGDPSDFVGLSNFAAVASDSYFWNAFRNSIVFMLGVAPGQLLVGLVFAIILNTQLRGAVVYRTLLFLPVVTTAAIVGLVMPMIFSPVSGPVNDVLVWIGLIDRPVDWVGAPDTAMRTVMIVAIWKWSGTYMIYWLAGLQSIPDELYEAAEVEGAGALQQIRYITLPMLRRVAAVITLLCVVANLKPFDLIKTMTNGGPFYRTDVVMTYIYRYAFSPELGLPRLGYASAAGIFYGVVVITLAAGQYLLTRRARAGDRPAVGSRATTVRV
jgi:multiple sugar transport system permease protein